jgi:hypothetical protein
MWVDIEGTRFSEKDARAPLGSISISRFSVIFVRLFAVIAFAALDDDL